MFIKAKLKFSKLIDSQFLRKIIFPNIFGNYRYRKLPVITVTDTEERTPRHKNVFNFEGSL